MEDEGRLEFRTSSRYVTNLDTLVRAGSHVFVDPTIIMKSLIALDFTRTGMSCTIKVQLLSISYIIYAKFIASMTKPFKEQLKLIPFDLFI